MHPTLIDLGFFPIPSYGVMVALGVVAGLLTLKRRADKAGLDGSRLVDIALWLVIWALLGAKALLVIVEHERYLANPGELWQVWRAGGVFLGGFVAAVIAGVMLIRRYGLRPLPTLDVLVPSLALGQAIGRVGCLLAGCCWGAQCELPWAITYTDPQAAANVGTPLHTELHPFPLYAALLNFAIFIVLDFLYARRLRAGRVFAAYLALYGVGRFLLEFTRGDASRGFVLDGMLSTSQLISVIMIAVGIVIWLRSRSNTER